MRLGEEREAEGGEEQTASTYALRVNEDGDEADEDRELEHEVRRVSSAEWGEPGVGGDDQPIVVHSGQRLFEQVRGEEREGERERARHPARRAISETNSTMARSI